MDLSLTNPDLDIGSYKLLSLVMEMLSKLDIFSYLISIILYTINIYIIKLLYIYYYIIIYTIIL